MKILVINAGSSSLKFQLIDMEIDHPQATAFAFSASSPAHLAQAASALDRNHQHPGSRSNNAGMPSIRHRSRVKAGPR